MGCSILTAAPAAARSPLIGARISTSCPAAKVSSLTACRTTTLLPLKVSNAWVASSFGPTPSNTIAKIKTINGTGFIPPPTTELFNGHTMFQNERHPQGWGFRTDTTSPHPNQRLARLLEAQRNDVRQAFHNRGTDHVRTSGGRDIVDDQGRARCRHDHASIALAFAAAAEGIYRYLKIFTYSHACRRVNTPRFRSSPKSMMPGTSAS